MEFSQLIQKRRACHSFVSGQSIPKTDILKIIQETSLTPSGYNAQPWEFIVIQDQNHIEEVGEIAFSQSHVKDASALIVVLGDSFIGRNVDTLLADWLKFGHCTEKDLPNLRNSIAKNRKSEQLKKMALRNAMLACMTLIYSAENMGYATCPVMGFNQKKLITTLQIPDDRVIALLIAVGYLKSGNDKPRLPRKDPSSLIHWEKFNTDLIKS